MIATAQIVHQHPFFTNLSEKESRTLIENSSNHTFEKGEYLLRQSEPANEFYLLGSGKVSIETVNQADETVPIDLLGEGQILGLSWLFPPYTWQFDARAVETTNTLVFDAQVLRSICEQDHELAYQLMRRYGQILLERMQSIRHSLTVQNRSSTYPTTQHRGTISRIHDAKATVNR